MMAPMPRLTGIAAALVLTAAGLAGCTSSPPAPEGQGEPIALAVTIVHGGDTLDEQAQAELESEVGDVLSEYVVRAFLGDYPREDFVRAFDSFTSGAARYAAGDIDVLTASSLDDVTAVTATALEARLSFIVADTNVIGATAHVEFRFEATDDAGETHPLSLTGRFMLQHDQDTWSVFGYDVSRENGEVAEAEESS